MAKPTSRQRANNKGHRAEQLAALFLQVKGYAIIARRYRASGGEVDLIAKRGKRLVFVEVKARATKDAAIEAVTPRNRRRIENAVAHFLSRDQRFSDHEVRYDIAAVCGWRVHHLPDAWRQGE